MKSRLGLAAVSCVLLLASPAHAADDDVPDQIVTTMYKLFGSYPATRANHAKGVVFEGTFSPGPDGATLSKATLFSTPSVPVTVRFSDSTGVPNIPDGDGNANPHGMSIKFRVPGGDEVDIVANSLAFFPVATGEEFRDLLQAVLDSPEGSAKPTKLEQFFGKHPAAPAAFGSVKTPASFATEAYNGIDSFVFVSTSGEKRPFRFRIEPKAGETHLSKEDAAKLAPDALIDDIKARVAKEPVSFTLKAQLAEAGDPVDDATRPFPVERKVVDLGTITLKTMGVDAKDFGFLPTNLTDGIEPSADPLIALRTSAYAISFSKRAQ